MRLMELLKDHQGGQDETQLQSFVLGGHTEWGTYKQALRELYTRVRSLRTAQTSYDELLLDIEEAEEELPNLSGRDLARAKLRLRKMCGDLEEIDRTISTYKREIAIFFREAVELKKSIGDVSPEKRVELDRKEWRFWHIKKAAISKLTTGRLPDVVLSNLCALPIKERQEWASVLKNDAALLRFLEQTECGRPALPPPSDEEIKLLETELDENMKLLVE